MQTQKVRWIPASLGAALAVLWVACLGLGGCTILLGEDQDFHLVGNGDAGPEMACTNSSECNDGNACTTGTCNPEGICVFTTVPDGKACMFGSEDSPGQCQNGACVSVTCDTANDCPAMACQTASCDSTGMCTYTEQSDGTACTGQGGSAGFCTKGTCAVACTSSSMCTNGNECQTATCDGATGTCSYSNVPDGTPASGDVTGDCQTHICVGGVNTQTIDNANLPAAVNDCGTPTCTAGVPSQSYTQHPAESVCSTYMTNQPGVCDGMGNCVQCLKAADCASKGVCQTIACTAGACVYTNVPDGTMTPGDTQPVGTCHAQECMGGVDTLVVDDTNLPPVATDCQTGQCTAGVPSTTDNANGTTCPTPTSTTGFVCNASGQCGCNLATDCLPAGENWTCVSKVCVCTKNTCAGLGLTCGSASDGCGGMLNCNTGMTEGAETAPDCGGPTTACATRCAQGATCKLGTDCASGFCADGVCCNTACTGLTCQACSAAAKGQGSNGVCGAVAAGASNDPHHDCSTTAVSTCGASGGCNGAGACNTYPNGTPCTTQSCSAGTVTNPKTCASGTCTAPTPATLSCSPYAICSGINCGTTCNQDTDCVSGDYCTGTAGMCTPKLTQGIACTSNHQCLNDACTDGYCCNMACTAQCTSCANQYTGMSNGTCGNITTGVADPVQPCTTQASTTCGTNGKCAAGACQDWPAGTTCSNVSGCSGNMLTTDTQCSGTGTCSQGPTTEACPNGLSCNSAMTACLGSCAGSDSNCSSGFYCNSSNVCTAKEVAGTACTAADQCMSGICSTNCCTANCTAAPPCGNTGACSNTGACVQEPNTTTCSSESCSGSTLTTDTKCNGSGSCSSSPTMSACPNDLECNSGGTACLASCAGSDVNCVSGYYCNSSNVCTPKQATGTCTNNVECTSGNCGTTGTGNCCTAASCGTGTCAATSCASNGSCNFQPNTVACGSPACNTATSMISMCTGTSASCGTPTACPNHLACLSDGAACNGSCGANDAADDPNCASGYWCDGSAGCVATLSTGSTCDRGSMCTSGTCSSFDGGSTCD